MSVINQVSRRRSAMSTRPRSQAPEQLPISAEPPTRQGPLGIDVVPLTLIIDCLALAGACVIMDLGAKSTFLFAALALSLNAVGGLHRPRMAPSLLDEFPSLLARALVAGALTTASRLYLSLPVGDGPVYAALWFLLLASVGRAVGYPFVRRHRVTHKSGRPTIVVGCGQVGNRLVQTLLEHPDYGLTPVGYIDDDPLTPAGERPVPLLGGMDQLAPLLRQHRIRNVIVAFSTHRESVMVDMLRSCDRLSCEIFFVPRLFELQSAGHNTELIWGLPLTRLTRASYRTLTWRTKRIFDFLIACFGLIVLSPFFVVCALAVRLEGGPGVIFKQERIGQDGKPFTILKFRSLKPDNEAESSQRWNIVGDPRLGPVGRTMRNLSLDELPQLWNVVRGQMSLVGPRPERPTFVDEFTVRFPRYVARHRVPVGLTGWAQVNGLRGDTDIADRATFDNYYIENWSMWTDIKIILRTAGQIIGRRGR